MSVQTRAPGGLPQAPAKRWVPQQVLVEDHHVGSLNTQASAGKGARTGIMVVNSEDAKKTEMLSEAPSSKNDLRFLQEILRIKIKDPQSKSRNICPNPEHIC